MELNPASSYQIWGIDNVVYGPMDLPTLIDCVKNARVEATTWIYKVDGDAWQKAFQMPELRMFFAAHDEAKAVAVETTFLDATAEVASKPGMLRRIKAFADFTDQQLSRFVKLMEVVRVHPFAELVKQGQPGDTMYFVLEGELRARMLVAGKESTLVTLIPGDFFGEISLFDRGPRSADVVANRESILLKISIESFEKLLNEAPDLASPFLLSMGKTLTARIRADNKRFRDSVHVARSTGAK